QAYAYALGAEDWAAQILRRDKQGSATDALTEAWATPIAGLPIEGGQLGGQLEDMQGRFNLNSLIQNDGTPNQSAANQFRRLLNALGIDAPLEKSVADWLDADQRANFPGGAEDGDYLRLTPAYRTGTGMMASVSELRLIAGVTPEIYAALAPYVAALPYRDTLINVNTAPLPVLQSLTDGLDPARLEELIASRQEKPFATSQEFYGIAGIRTTDRDQPPPPVEVSSNFFRLHAVVSIGNITLNLYS